MRTFSICSCDESIEPSIPNAVAAIRKAFTLAVVDQEQARNSALRFLIGCVRLMHPLRFKWFM